MTEKDFINNQREESKKLVKWVIDRLEREAGLQIENVIGLTQNEIEDVIIKMKPSNIKMVTNFAYVLGLYAKYTDDFNLYENISNIDRKSVWNKYKESGNLVSRFISHEEFIDLIFNIEIHPRIAYPIIQDELNRSGYKRDAKYFRQMVVGHLNEF